MERRERVIRALNYQAPDQLPKDLSGMRSTGISCFAYPGLVKALGLPPRRPRIYDVGQMLALPESDVLDALDCDVVVIEGNGVTNAFDQPERWHPYDFDGRLEALVQDPQSFTVRSDGAILSGKSCMPPASFVFTAPHGGQEIDFNHDLKQPDLKLLQEELERKLLTDECVNQISVICQKARAATKRAIFFCGPSAGLGFPSGMANWSMVCLLDPGYVRDCHDLVTDYAVKNMERLLPSVQENIDILMVNADDQGTQNATILPPDIFFTLYVPFYKKVNSAIKKLAPHVKRFLHSCGAIYEILDGIIEGGFDVLNPVQWTAGGHSFLEWKDKCRNRLALWGGGVDSQTVLPLRGVDEVVAQVQEVVPYLKQDNGYIFTSIHNILAEIEPAKVVAMYRTAASVL